MSVVCSKMHFKEQESVAHSKKQHNTVASSGGEQDSVFCSSKVSQRPVILTNPCQCLRVKSFEYDSPTGKRKSSHEKKGKLSVLLLCHELVKGKGTYGCSPWGHYSSSL